MTWTLLEFLIFPEHFELSDISLSTLRFLIFQETSDIPRALLIFQETSDISQSALRFQGARRLLIQISEIN